MQLKSVFSKMNFFWWMTLGIATLAFIFFIAVLLKEAPGPHPTTFKFCSEENCTFYLPQGGNQVFKYDVHNIDTHGYTKFLRLSYKDPISKNEMRAYIYRATNSSINSLKLRFLDLNNARGKSLEFGEIEDLPESNTHLSGSYNSTKVLVNRNGSPIFSQLKKSKATFAKTMFEFNQEIVIEYFIPQSSSVEDVYIYNAFIIQNIGNLSKPTR